MKLVLVEWVDAWSKINSGWKSFEDFKKMDPLPAKSVGFLMKETKDCLVLVGTVCEGEGDSDICIPRGCIVKIEVLKKDA